jgi:hypothetical protein
MAAEGFVLGHVVDDDGLPGLADLVADRSLDLQLAAGLKSELNIVTDGACDPAILGHPGNGGKPHPGTAAHDFKDGRHGVNAIDSGDIRFEISRHVGSILLLRGTFIPAKVSVSSLRTGLPGRSCLSKSLETLRENQGSPSRAAFPSFLLHKAQHPSSHSGSRQLEHVVSARRDIGTLWL